MKNLKGLFGVGVSVLLLLPLSAGATITTQSATLNGASTATVDVGASVTATVTANITSNNDWHGTEWRISTTSPGTMTCFNTPDHDNGSGVSTESFGITAPTLTGTYNVYFQARGGSTCNGAQGGVLAMIGALTVTSGGAASAAISADSTTVEAGTGLVTLTITLRDQYGNLVADNTSATLLSTLGTINGSGNTVNGVMTRTLSSNQIGSATLSFSGMTMSGNTSIVFQDTTAPTITLLGSNPQTVLVGQAYTELGATVSDNYDSSLSATIDASMVDTNTLGSYSVTYNVTDSNSNVATQVTRTVNVVDQDAPVITLLGANPQNIEVGQSYTELGATVSDNVDTGLAPTVNASAVDTNTVGSYMVTYDAVDSSANSATQVTRTVNVIAPVPVSVSPSQPNFIPSGRRNTFSGGQVLGAFTDIFSSTDNSPLVPEDVPVQADPEILSELSSLFAKLSSFLQQQIALAQAAARN
jgi:hypothetical protein